MLTRFDSCLLLIFQRLQLCLKRFDLIVAVVEISFEFLKRRDLALQLFKLCITLFEAFGMLLLFVVVLRLQFRELLSVLLYRVFKLGLERCKFGRHR